MYLAEMYGIHRPKERAQAGGAAGRGRSRLLLSREPDAGLDPRTLGS